MKMARVSLSTKIPPALAQRLDELARRSHRSRAEVALLCLEVAVPILEQGILDIGLDVEKKLEE